MQKATKACTHTIVILIKKTLNFGILSEREAKSLKVKNYNNLLKALIISSTFY